MTEWPREVFIDLTPEIRIRYGRMERPPIMHAITLETRVNDHWTAIRLWDNAHDPEEHHEHEYTQQEGKRKPIVLTFASSNEAMATAIRAAAQDWQMFLERWRSR